MGRRRKAWLPNGDGKRTDRGRELPGYYVLFRDGGKYRSKCFDRKADAVTFRNNLNRRFERLGSMGLLPVTVDDASRAFGLELTRLAKSTRRQIAHTVGKFVGQVGDDTPMSQITGADVDRYVRSLGDVSESTAAKHVRYLKRFFRWCMLRGYVHVDPTRLLTVRVRATSRQIRLPTNAEIGKLLASIQSTTIRAAASIALTTGLDRGVIASLTPEDFDLAERVIRTRRRKTARSYSPDLVLPIHKSLLSDLRSLLARTSPQTPVFPDYWSRVWYREARRQAGPPWDQLRVADFRKIASARLQRAGLPIAQVQRLLGHSTVAVTAKHYTPEDPAARQALDSLPLVSSADTRPRRQRKRA